ncbi:MAG: Asp-tRNA(Asn)/Glu-tRNA(Gln) amidotransferase subunit GatC [Lentisphaeraceae bacterium]|nr:Asp-tRNA(Asn)/Glu-tRNA(Gln) amidotransferase subunit GatC [Lentisphaeraceae bacterium]
MSQDFDVEHFAKLARLHLSKDEVPSLKKEMNDILGMVGEILELDLDGVEGTNFAVTMENVIREDEAGKSLPAERAAATFPDSEDNLNKVPVILEDND